MSACGSNFSCLTISATARDTMSPPLPADVWTVTSIGLTGYFCADAGRTAPAEHAPTIPQTMLRSQCFMLLSSLLVAF